MEPSGSRQAFDDLDHLITAIALDPTEFDELSYTLDDGSVFNSPGHGDAPAALKVEQTLIAEDVERTEDGVLVDPHDGCHVLGQG
jgi:hypothetical protein